MAQSATGKPSRLRLGKSVFQPRGLRLGYNAWCVRRDVPDGVSASPDGADDVGQSGFGQLVADLADEHVDDLDLGLVQAAIQVGQDGFLGHDHIPAQHQQF